jgi:hypothetical protein
MWYTNPAEQLFASLNICHRSTFIVFEYVTLWEYNGFKRISDGEGAIGYMKLLGVIIGNKAVKIEKKPKEEDRQKPKVKTLEKV